MSFLGGLTGGINQTSRTLTSIQTISDGFVEISGGTINMNNGAITNLGNLDIENLTVNNTTFTGNINATSGVYSYLNAGAFSSTNALITNLGVNFLESGVLLTSNIIPLNDLPIYIGQGNLDLNLIGDNINFLGNIALGDINAGNITATNKIINQNSSFLNKIVSYSGAITNLNSKSIKSNFINCNSINCNSITSQINIPIYDSGFFSVALNTRYVKTLPFTIDLNYPPVFQVIFSNGNTGNFSTSTILDITSQGINSAYAQSYGLRLLTNTSIRISTGISYVALVNDAGTGFGFTAGYYRIYAR